MNQVKYRRKLEKLLRRYPMLKEGPDVDAGMVAEEQREFRDNLWGRVRSWEGDREQALFDVIDDKVSSESYQEPSVGKIVNAATASWERTKARIAEARRAQSVKDRKVFVRGVALDQARRYVPEKGNIRHPSLEEVVVFGGCTDDEAREALESLFRFMECPKCHDPRAAPIFENSQGVTYQCLGCQENFVDTAPLRQAPALQVEEEGLPSGMIETMQRGVDWFKRNGFETIAARQQKRVDELAAKADEEIPF